MRSKEWTRQTHERDRHTRETDTRERQKHERDRHTRDAPRVVRWKASCSAERAGRPPRLSVPQIGAMKALLRAFLQRESRTPPATKRASNRRYEGAFKGFFAEREQDAPRD